MKKIEEQTIIKQMVTGIYCDVCGVDLLADYHADEYISLGDIGGYYSVIGDMVKWEIDICQGCFYEAFRNHIRIIED